MQKCPEGSTRWMKQKCDRWHYARALKLFESPSVRCLCWWGCSEHVWGRRASPPPVLLSHSGWGCLPAPRLKMEIEACQSRFCLGIFHIKPDIKCFLTRLQVQDHVQGLAVVRHLLIQARQVELVLYVVFIHLLWFLLNTRAHKYAAIIGVHYSFGTLLPHTDVAALHKHLTRLPHAAANIEDRAKIRPRLRECCLPIRKKDQKKQLHNETTFTLSFQRLLFAKFVLADRKRWWRILFCQYILQPDTLIYHK